MNQKLYSVKTLLNASVTAAATGSYVDLAGQADVAKREMKLIITANSCTYQTANKTTWPIVVEECATTNGTYTSVDGDTISDVGTTDVVSTYTVKPKYRYVRARIGTIGTGGTSVGIAVLLQSLSRSA